MTYPGMAAEPDLPYLAGAPLVRARRRAIQREGPLRRRTARPAPGEFGEEIAEEIAEE